MRVCDKCETKILYTTLLNKKDSTEVDLCSDCYQIFSDWIYNPDRKKENDPIENKKEVVNNARRTKR